ncbi:MAG: hypothetical protein ABIH52_00680 [Candidatus Aenigmatarchaeota archaeon]|nr:hypothetical protein [Nanoarchaeota archaeon]
MTEDSNDRPGPKESKFPYMSSKLRGILLGEGSTAEGMLGGYVDALSDAMDPEELRKIFYLGDNFLMLQYGNPEKLFEAFYSGLEFSPDMEGGFERSYNIAQHSTTYDSRPHQTFEDEESGILIRVGGFQYPLYSDELLVDVNGKPLKHATYIELGTPVRENAPKGDLLTFAHKDVTIDMIQYVMGHHITTRMPLITGIWPDGVNHVPKYPKFMD